MKRFIPEGMTEIEAAEHRAKMCLGKQRFESKAETFRFIDKKGWRASRSRKVTGAKLQSYKCPYCHFFHVGSGEKNRFRRFILKLGR